MGRGSNQTPSRQASIDSIDSRPPKRFMQNSLVGRRWAPNIKIINPRSAISNLRDILDFSAALRVQRQHDSIGKSDPGV
jgi:hypothetical protein